METVDSQRLITGRNVSFRRPRKYVHRRRSWAARAVALNPHRIHSRPDEMTNLGECWKCGYDLHGHQGDRCPECGASKQHQVAVNRAAMRSMGVLVLGGFVTGASLVACSFFLSGAGHGSYLPTVIFFGPLAWLGMGGVLVGGVPLYLAYSLVCAHAIGSAWSTRLLSGVAGLHYASVIAYYVLNGEVLADELDSVSRVVVALPVPSLFSVMIFVVFHCVIIYLVNGGGRGRQIAHA
jgi:hypothetical protein